ncbi:ABC transporter permease subunit [Motiliproteus sp. MSK22-1]|uniref:ABC transporter permease subunit n=1 Tax=Motiliproteus sp. MSK22-1 TaxID=1897630 RepID=UPI000976EF23|nr:ABC transporter permease subunit [Motiliproteus sp. MSK22-1]OMH38909.1 putrescine ABC transporter permease PotH [Motiliproteus sp. MSK22-1]
MNKLLKKLIPDARTGVVAIPYVWLLLFFLMPFLIVFQISFAESEISIPPYSAIVEYVDEVLTFNLNLGNFLLLLEDDLYFVAYLSSVKIALISTFICLLISYPMAYAIARAEPRTRNILLMLVVLPSWTSFLIRIYAWIGLLKNNGLINNMLIGAGIIDEPIHLLHTDFAVYLGIVYAYLPFMVLPIYSNLIKLDGSLLEASADLGAKPWKTFFTVTLPLSKAGIIAGSMLVFIPVVGEFVIPELLGSPSTLMIGKVLWQEFFNNRDWPVAAAVAMVMLGLLLIPIVLFNRYQLKEMETQ